LVWDSNEELLFIFCVNNFTLDPRFVLLVVGRESNLIGFSPLLRPKMQLIHLSSFGGKLAQIGASGLLSGGISKVSGGDFQSGFINGGLVGAFNHLPHRMPPRSGMREWPYHPIRVGGENIAVMGQGGLDFAEYAATVLSVWYSMSENGKMFQQYLSFLTLQNGTRWPRFC